jgi:hypothetical protein
VERFIEVSFLSILPEPNQNIIQRLVLLTRSDASMSDSHRKARKKTAKCKTNMFDITLQPPFAKEFDPTQAD